MEDLRVKNKDEGAHVDIEEALSCSILLNIAFAVEAEMMNCKNIYIKTA